MSEDRRKNLRTQGKYSDGKVPKNRDKKQRNSQGSKDSPEARLPNRNSDGYKSGNNSLTDESAHHLKYEENSDYTFRQFKEVVKAEELKGCGEFILSKTDNGESRILYEPQFLFEDEGNNYFNLLYESVTFDSRNIIIHGVEYPQPRLVAWFGPFPYSYSGTTLEPAEMPDVVKEIKEKVEAYLKSKGIEEKFNSVLINLYRDGKDSVSWHSDDELMLGICPTIASVSLGETRKFEMRPKMRNHEDKSPSDPTCKYLIHLTHGSLVIMTGSMQDDWQHRVPKEYHDKGPRLNLTFRKVYPLEKAPEHVPVKETNLETTKKSSGRSNSSTSSKYGYKLDEDHFPSLQKDATSTKFNISGDMNDNTDEKNWDIGISHNEHNTEIGVTSKNMCPDFNIRGEDFNSKVNGKSSFNHEKPSDVWHNIEPKCDNEKNLQDDKTTKKLWCDDFDASVNEFLENEQVEEKYNIKCNKSIKNSANEVEGNKFYEKTDLRKVYNKETGLIVKSSQQNVLNQEECSSRSYNIKTNSYKNVTEENGIDNEEPLNACQDVKKWVDSSDENNLGSNRKIKMSLNVNAKAFTNSYVNVIQENDLSSKKPPNVCHSDENNLWINSLEEHNLEIRQPAKPMLNVDAKEFIPKSSEIVEFSELRLEDLIRYDMNLLQGEILQDYSRCLKEQILNRFQEISRFERKDLEFLLEITDGSQTDKNQKLISKQICKIVHNNLQRNRQPSSAMSPFDRSPRSHGYDNQNYYSDKGKRYPNQNRNPKFSRNRY